MLHARPFLRMRRPGRAWEAPLSGALALTLLAGGGCDLLFDEALIDAPTGGPCEGRRPPPRPLDSPGSAVELPPSTFVLHELVVDTSRSWRGIGLNLDGLCSDGERPVVECLPASGRHPETDGDEGIDNVFGHQIMPVALLLEPAFEEILLDVLAHGHANVALSLGGYDGDDDDADVRVHFAHTVYGAAPAADGSAPEVTWDGEVARDADGHEVTPAWTGDDYFWVRAADFDGGLDAPLLRAPSAYVKGRVLVAELGPSAPFVVPLLFAADGSRHQMVLEGGTLTARISEDATALHDVVLSGRWSAGHFMSQVERAGYCRGTVEHDIALALVDDVVDLRLSAGTGGPGVTCDAMSVGLRGAALRGRVVGLVATPAEPDPCAAL